MSSPDADINKVKMKYKLSKEMEKELINLKK
jgi:hypothetical protein